MSEVDLGPEFKDVPGMLLIQNTVTHAKHIVGMEATNRHSLDSPSLTCCEG